MTLRERAGWGALVAASVLAFADAALRPWTPIVGGLRASTFGGALVLAPLAIVFVAGAARRDEAVSASDMVGSRPYPGHALLLPRFAANYAVALLGYLLVIVCSLLPSLLLGGKVASPLTPLHALVRGLVPLFYVTALAFCAVTLARNVLAAAVVAVYWLFVLLWGDFLARIFDFTLTQNWPTYAALGLAALLGTMAIRRRLERVVTPGRWSKLLPGAAVTLLVFGLLGAWHRVAHSHDKPLRQDPLMLNMAAQYLKGNPRLPGFWLPDQHGRGFRMASAQGRVVAVAFWSPHVPRSVPALDVLREASREFPADQVACMAVALSNDHALSPHVAAEGGYGFPLVSDIGTHYAGNVKDCGPMAEAYVLGDVPYVYVTDRARRFTSMVDPLGPDGREQLRIAIQQALSIPVPPP